MDNHIDTRKTKFIAVKNEYMYIDLASSNSKPNDQPMKDAGIDVGAEIRDRRGSKKAA